MLTALLDFAWEAAKVTGQVALVLVIVIVAFGSMGEDTEED